MKILPPERFPQRDRASLLAFLGYCRDAARHANAPRLASITLEVAHIDPLGVLDSIFEAGEAHGYVEHVQADEALAGAEAVVSFQACGPRRFTEAEVFTEKTFATAITTGDPEAPFSGPHLLSSFTFAHEVTPESSFAPAHLFVPRWQVGKKQGRYSATANLLIDSDVPLEPLADRVLAAHAKFSRFEYRPSASSVNSPPPVLRPAYDVADADAFRAKVRLALEQIRANQIEKVVLARALDYQADAPLQPLHALNLLRERYPGCHAFSFSQGTGPCFIGASPEKLFRISAGNIETEALAGSIKRGADAREDADLERTLLSSEKDLREHALVVAFIREKLLSLGVSWTPPPAPRLLKLANVCHLLTPVYMPRQPGLDFFDLAGLLHPTPALGGVPQQNAVRLIGELEGFDRELYGGLVGWTNGCGEGLLVVGIRSGKVEHDRVRLYSGAGIVRDSDPDAEFHETDLKLDAMLRSLQ